MDVDYAPNYCLGKLVLLISHPVICGISTSPLLTPQWPERLHLAVAPPISHTGGLMDSRTALCRERTHCAVGFLHPRTSGPHGPSTYGWLAQAGLPGLDECQSTLAQYHLSRSFREPAREENMVYYLTHGQPLRAMWPVGP